MENIVLIEGGALEKLPEVLSKFGITHPFLLSGHDTFAAAGLQVTSVLEKSEISYGKYVFANSPVKPTEYSVGSAVMHYDYDCDGIVGIGSGVINDIGKILARTVDLPYIIVATAPSMDGYASATSSMERDGLKVSIDSKMPNAIIGDLDILSHAPKKMLQAGIGDMLAKYISIAEWRISNIINGEEFQEDIAELIQKAVAQVVEAAKDLENPDSVRSIMEGLIIAGMAMKDAGCSRPASGMEHYYSHIWDMRALAFDNAKSDLHGIQCGISTLLCLKDYEKIRAIKPDKEKALRFVSRFRTDAWFDQLKSFIGPGAKAMIEGEFKEGKYDKEKHAARLEVILARWDEIIEVIDTLPAYEDVYNLMVSIGAPTDPAYLDYDSYDLRSVFWMTKDIRDKYIGSRLCWDLGEIDLIN